MALWSEMSDAFSRRYQDLLNTDDDRAPMRAVAAEIRVFMRWIELHRHLPPEQMIAMLEAEVEKADNCR